MAKTTIDSAEISKFEQHANVWWDREGELKTLHDINPARLAFIESHQKIQGKKILDVGCGGGILTEAMAAKGGHCSGLDAEAQAIKTAKSHAKAQNLKIAYHAMPLESFEEQNFDLVVCMEMLEHVANPDQVISHCARVLKPGGWLFLSTINRTLKAYAAAIVAAEYLLGLLPRQTHDYEKFIPPSEMAKMLRHAGLELIDLKGMNYNPLSRTASLVPDVSVNYLIACRLDQSS